MKFIYLFTGVLMAVIMASCGPSAEELNRKLESGDALERADYEAMAEYVSDVCTDLMRLMDDDIVDPNYSADRVAALENVEATYPYFITFGRALYHAPDKALAKEVMKDIGLGSKLLIIAGLPEARKVYLPEDWRSPMMTFIKQN